MHYLSISFRCCGQCNTFASFADPYQACPVLSSRAHDGSLESMESWEVMLLSAGIVLILVFWISFIAWLCIYFQDYDKRMDKLIKDNKGKESS